MEHSEQINELAAALAKAQSEIIGAAKSADNPFFKSKYADLAACWDACRGPLTKNGLCVIQTPSTSEEGAVVLTTMLAHQSGQWMRDSMACRPTKGDAQALGSVTTYLRRYGLAAIVGLAQVDDDGEAAVGRGDGKAAALMTPAKAKDEWNGPLNKTALKKKVHDLHTELQDARYKDRITALTDEYSEIIEQLKIDRPTWWEGEGDVEGLQTIMERLHTELPEYEEESA